MKKFFMLSALIVSLTTSAMAQGTDANGNIIVSPATGSVANFQLYTKDVNGDYQQKNVNKNVSILTDVQVGEQYLVIEIPGQPTIVVHRDRAGAQDTTPTSACQNRTGWFCYPF